MKRSAFLLSSALLAALLLAGCEAGESSAPREEPPAAPPLFERLPAERTGVSFANTLAEAPRLNILNYLYYYNGGGVAVGDLNGDDRPDLYFTANEGPNRLYLNRGGFQFEDVTEQAGVAGTAGWTSGVTLADVNGDGRLDLYVSVVSDALELSGANALYINQGADSSGVPTFRDEAGAYGLAHRGYSTHAAFFDYDRDGDLDCYLVNHSTHTEDTYRPARVREERHPRAGDKLYRNDGNSFTDVSEEAGIYGGRTGYGLGVAVSDLTGDGWPDLYVANDFHENDFLYVNNQDGTFTESIRAATGHTSRFSMGADAADFNNDGWPDLAVLDMLPAREAIRKTSAAARSYDVARIQERQGYYHQLARNTLQLNEGVPRSRPGQAPRFSEIGALAGVEATDWSWAPLFADLDLDGWKDLFVSNGIYRRPNDLDYINYVSDEAVRASLDRSITEENLALTQRMPQIAIPNYAFRNNGDLTFTNRAEAWGLGHAGFSNGAAYADLDGDGDLDLVTNNINEAASIYENRARQQTGRHYLTVRLRGTGANTDGIGAQVTLWHRGRQQMQEMMATRGYQSAVPPRLHFGLDTTAVVDSLTVRWPDGRLETRTRVAADQTIALHQDDAAPAAARARQDDAPPLFADITDALGLDYAHAENDFVDFNRERLIPRMLSTEGPALAVGDVNGDGLDDLFAGGAKWQPARLLVQRLDGRFAAMDGPWRADSTHEDIAAAFFDADGDGDTDLFVVSGGNEFWGSAEALQHRLYVNDGTGRFRRDAGALPGGLRSNGACVTSGDYDGDGDQDLFVGARVVARRYGLTPRSVLLENDGAGRFRDVTAERAPALAEAGMITDAVWTDLGGDGQLDLVVVGEWMPVRVFVQQPDGRLAERTDAMGLEKSHGWWNAVHAADFDGDGDDDLVLGNLGRNAVLDAAPDAPARLYLHDFDGNGSLDPILTSYRDDGVSYPFASRDLLVEQMPSLKRKFPDYASFGAGRLEDLFPATQIDSARVLEAHTFTTSYAENDGGAFTLRPLPMRAQFAPVHAIAAEDIDGDGAKDVVLAGNFYGVPPVQGRYDASHGLLLRGDGQGEFEAAPPAATGLWIDGEARHLALLQRAGGSPLLVVARNDQPLQVFRLRSSREETPEDAVARAE